MTRLAVLIATATLSLAAAPAALADTAVMVSGGVMTITAAPGDANQLTLSAAGAAVHVEDAGATPVPGPDCAIAGAGVDCTGVTAVAVDLGDGDDTLDASASPAPVTVDAGAGADTVTASAFADTITGGAGADDVTALAANDTLHLADAETDTADCGVGADDASDSDGADALTGCEESSLTAGPPDTSVVSGPPVLVASSSAIFGFGASEPATFECRLDGGAWQGCTTPATFTGLGDGGHSLEVRATDLLGQADASAALHTWTVDTTAPVGALTAVPAPLTNDAAPRFAATADEAAVWHCSVDAGAWQPCTADHRLEAGVADGPHTYALRPSDAAGNVGAPVVAAWVQDTLRPQTKLLSGPQTSAPVTSAEATFSFEASEAGRYECRLDGGPWEPCTTPTSYTGLPNGQHTFDVRAVDPAGNADGTPASRSWTVQAHGAPDAVIAVTREDDGFRLSGAGSRDPEGAQLTYRWLHNGQPAGAGRAITFAQPDKPGEDRFSLTVTDPLGRQGRAEVSFSTTSSRITVDHETLRIVRFGRGARPTAAGSAELKALRAVVASAQRISLEGHVSSAVAPARRSGLARARATAVRRALLATKRTAAKVAIAARGAARPAATNATAAGRSRNDRVTVTIRHRQPVTRLVTVQDGEPRNRLDSGPSTAPLPSGGRTPKLFAFWSRNGSTGLRRLKEVGDRVSILAPNWYTLDPTTGAVTGGAPDRTVMGLSRQLRFAVWPVVNATMTGSPLIERAAGRAAVSGAIARLARRHGMAGVTLDMEEMAPGQKDEFTALVRDLAARLHADGRKLALYAVRRTATRVTDSAAAYDWPALTRHADVLIASGYNEHGPTSAPGPLTTRAGFADVLGYARSVSRTKVAPAIGAFGWKWVGDAVGQLVASEEAERRWPAPAPRNSADGRVVRQGATVVGYESAEDLWARERAVRASGASWIALFSLGREPERFWERSILR
ncbi:MAG TPA: OmpA family protein [Baekduia sp.]|nr:OmpA family protein [Baekduia sp.]